MYTRLRILFCFAFSLHFAATAFCQQPSAKPGTSIKLRVMSFNIRNGKARDGENRWENRKDFVCDLVKQNNLDVVGLQEAFDFQLQYLQKNLSEYSVVGEGRDGGQKGEYSAILFRKNRFTVKDSGTFWLSDTPEKKSRSWGNRYLRICTWTRLLDSKSHRAFYVYNTHFDHQSQNARIESAKLIARRISQRKFADPFILTGDFNASENNEVILYLKGKTPWKGLAKSPIQLQDTFRVMHPDAKEVGTGGGFEGRKNGPKIDYIFVPEKIKTKNAAIIRDHRSGKYPSDHFPVVAEIEILDPRPDSASQPLSVASDFEGASVRVLKIDQQSLSISFMPGGDARRGWPCWWYLRVDGVPQRKTVTLRLRGSTAALENRKPLSSAWAMPKHAAFSTDGQTWQRTEPGRRENEWMIYQLRANQLQTADSVFVAWGPPYTPSMASKFVQNMAKQSPHAFARELCKSREGRSVPMLSIKEGPRPSNQRFGIWVQARQHAWESGSSWVAHGFAEWLLSDGKNDDDQTSDDQKAETKQAAWLRQHAEIFIVPIMDVDNAATGNGGKNALPHDHNRDWSAKPHWNEVRAAQRMVGKLIEDQRMDVFLDLHNPAPGDPSFFYTLPSQMLKEPSIKLRDRFIDLAYGRISKIKPLMPMSSQPKVTGAGYHPLWRQISSNWVALHGNPHTVSLCLETMWNYKNSTTEGYRAVGANLAAATREYLSERPNR